MIISVDLDGNLNYLHPGTANPTKVIRGHQRNITAAAISGPTEHPTLWTGSSDGRVRGWDISTGEAFQPDGESHTNYVSGIAAHEKSTHVHSAGWDDTLRTIDPTSRTFTGTGPVKTTGQPKSLSTNSTGTVAVATASGVELYTAGKRTSTIPAKGYSATCVATTDTLLAVGADNRSIHIYSLADPTTPQASITDSLLSAPLSMSFSPDGAHLAVGTTGGPIVVFKTADWSVATSRWSSHTSRVTSVAWSADGKYAASAGLDTNVHVWSLAAPGKRVKAGNAHKDGVNGIAWTEDGRVVSVGADAAVKVWKVAGLS